MSTHFIDSYEAMERSLGGEAMAPTLATVVGAGHLVMTERVGQGSRDSLGELFDAVGRSLVVHGGDQEVAAREVALDFPEVVTGLKRYDAGDKTVAANIGRWMAVGASVSRADQ